MFKAFWFCGESIDFVQFYKNCCLTVHSQTGFSSLPQPDILPPRFQYASLHPSFLRRFHLPSLYISLTHFPAPFALSFSDPPPSIALLSLSL